ncbi:MAG: hypothetical protein ACRDH1_04305 [Actinomycetota bacterium]
MTEADNRSRWDGRRGRHEAWFVTLSRPDGRGGYWIRYTLRAPIAGPPESRLWFARFDRDHPSRTFGLNGPPPGAGSDIQPGAVPLLWGHAACEAGAARGDLAGQGHLVRWDLRWVTGQESFRVLPPPFYRGGVAPTRPYSPNPDARISGVIDVDGEGVELDGWPGQQGHLEGRRHAERWAWASCAAFGDGTGYAVQALSAQGRRRPFRTPLVTFGGVRVDGRWVRLRGAGRGRSWSLGSWRLQLRSQSYRLEGEIRADRSHLIQARYLDPDDTPRWCHNSEIASSRFLVWERRAGGWQELAELVSDGTTHAEWAGRTPAPGSFSRHAEVA